MVWEELVEDIISKNLGIKHHNEESHESHDESSDQSELSEELSEMVHSLTETDKKVASVELDLSEIVEKLIPSSESSISHENGENEEGEEGNEGSEGSGSQQTEVVDVSSEGSYDAAGRDYVFHFAEGNYTYQIQNFEHGDALVFPEGADPTLINDDFSDGKVTVQWAANGNVINVHLVGLTQDEDNGLFYASDLGDALA